MSLKRRSVRVLLPIFAGLAFTTAALWPTAVPAPSSARLEQMRFDAWLKLHPEALPTSFDAVAAYPIAYRKVIYTQLGAAEKAHLWQAHVRSYLLPAESLSQVQRQTAQQLGTPLNERERGVLRLIVDSLLTYKAYDLTDTRTRKILADRLCDLMESAFDKRRTIMIAGMIGPVDTIVVSRIVSQVKHKQASMMMIPVGAVRWAASTIGLTNALMKIGVYNELTGCDCSIGSYCDGCWVGEYCVQSFPPCTQQRGICGCFGSGTCDGAGCMAGP